MQSALSNHYSVCLPIITAVANSALLFRRLLFYGFRLRDPLSGSNSSRDLFPASSAQHHALQLL